MISVRISGMQSGIARSSGFKLPRASDMPVARRTSGSDYGGAGGGPVRLRERGHVVEPLSMSDAQSSLSGCLD